MIDSLHSLLGIVSPSISTRGWNREVWDRNTFILATGWVGYSRRMDVIMQSVVKQPIEIALPR